MNPPDLRGIIPPLVTPMHADGSLNLAAVPALVDHLIQGGVHAIFAPSSQGEAWALSLDERAAMLDAVLEAVNGRVPVIAGTGAITTRDAVTLTVGAERAGASAAAVLTPFFTSPNQNELYDYYAAIAAATPLPLLAYANPARTGGVRVAPPTLARLAHDLPSFVGIKDSSGSLSEAAAILRACPAGFRVFVGSDDLTYAGLCYGAVGIVGMIANVVPSLPVAIYDAWQTGDHARAAELQKTLSWLNAEIVGVGAYPGQVKAALEEIAIPAGPPRAPIRPVGEQGRVRLRDVLKQVGVAPIR